MNEFAKAAMSALIMTGMLVWIIGLLIAGTALLWCATSWWMVGAGFAVFVLLVFSVFFISEVPIKFLDD